MKAYKLKYRRKPMPMPVMLEAIKSPYLREKGSVYFNYQNHWVAWEATGSCEEHFLPLTGDGLANWTTALMVAGNA